MDPDFFTCNNTMGGVKKSFTNKVDTGDVYDNLFNTQEKDNNSTFQVSNQIARHSEKQRTRQTTDSLTHNYINEMEKYHYDENVTNLEDLKSQFGQKLYSPRKQTASCERAKKRYIKHYGSAKTANRKSRSIAAPRRVASGPTRAVGSSSSSSDESQERRGCHLISAPDPAPSNSSSISSVRYRKRSPMERSKNTNKNRKEANLHLPLSTTNSGSMNTCPMKVAQTRESKDVSQLRTPKLSPLIQYRENAVICHGSKERQSKPGPLNLPASRDLSPSGHYTGNPASPGYPQISPCSPRSPRSPITRQRSPRLSPGFVSSPRYTMPHQLSHLPTIHHSPEQVSGASSRSSISNKNGENSSNGTLRSPRSPSTPANYKEQLNRLYSTSGNGPIGNLALLASRRRSVAAHGFVTANRTGRPSNYLELPVSDYEMRQKRERRYQSLPEEGINTGYNPRQIHSNEIYRLRAFSISPNGALINHGDQIATRKPRTSTSNNSTTNTTRSHSRNASPKGGRSPKNRSPIAGSRNTIWSEENGPLENTNRYNNGIFSLSQRSPWSTCGSSSVADGLEDLGDEFVSSVSLNRQNYSELQASISNDSDEEAEKLRVCLIGHIAVGKTSLCNQFKTSNYVNTFDASLDEDHGEKAVTINLDGIESEIVLLDFPSGEISVENMMSTYDPHAVIVVYSIIDRASFIEAEKILNYLWQMSYNETKGIILVANKIDLERSRVISHDEGKTIAQNTKVKFIEASVGIQHNIDELLVGVLKQIRLKREKSQGNSQNIGGESSPSKRSNKYYRRASSPLRTLQVARDILSKICITHQNSTTEGPCENLMVP